MEHKSTTKLLEIMTQLRDPDTGCPWDVEQDFDSIAPFTVEEAYEVCDAIERKDYTNLKEELGDLLLQVVFHSQIAKEKSLFTFEDVVEAINTKLVHRHPHVFGDTASNKAGNADDVEKIWNIQKEKEKYNSTLSKHTHVMDEVPRHFPALMRSQKIQKKAIQKGFNWSNIDGVFAKLEEELNELKEAIQSKDQNHIAEELGDLLFVCGILGRWLKVDAEDALQQANNKFVKRFNAVENGLKNLDISLDNATLEQMDHQWNKVKKTENKEV